MAAATDLIFVSILVLVPLLVVGYGTYALLHIDRVNSRLGGPPTVAARVLLRVVFSVGILMVLLVSVAMVMSFVR